MKARESSIYRQLEHLDLWCARVCAIIPRNVYLQEKGRLLAQYVSEALSCCALALDMKDHNSRLDLINSVIFNLTNVKSILKVFDEYSSSNPTHTRIISLKQRQDLLERLARVNSHIANWQTATLKQVKTDV